MSDATRKTVAATLRSVAAWCDTDRDRDELYNMATAVEAGDDDDCCPVCQEVTCDEDCPLVEVRNKQIPTPVLVPPEQVPTDLAECARCHQPLPLVGVVAVEHDCETGEVLPA